MDLASTLVVYMSFTILEEIWDQIIFPIRRNVKNISNPYYSYCYCMKMQNIMDFIGSILLTENVNFDNLGLLFFHMVEGYLCLLRHILLLSLHIWRQGCTCGKHSPYGATLYIFSWIFLHCKVPLGYLESSYFSQGKLIFGFISHHCLISLFLHMLRHESSSFGLFHNL